MAEQKITVKLDPGQVADLQQFVRDQIRGERAAVSTPLEGWVEVTTLPESGQRRVFIPRHLGELEVRTAQIELEKLRDGIRDILQDLSDLQDLPDLAAMPPACDVIGSRLRELLK